MTQLACCTRWAGWGTQKSQQRSVGASSWKEGSIVSQNEGSSAHAMPPPRPSNERASAGRPQRYENGEGTQAGAARRRSAILTPKSTERRQVLRAHDGAVV